MRASRIPDLGRSPYDTHHDDEHDEHGVSFASGSNSFLANSSRLEGKRASVHPSMLQTGMLQGSGRRGSNRRGSGNNASPGPPDRPPLPPPSGWQQRTHELVLRGRYVDAGTVTVRLPDLRQSVVEGPATVEVSLHAPLPGKPRVWTSDHCELAMLAGVSPIHTTVASTWRPT